VSFAPSALGLTGLRSFVWLDPAPETIQATAQVPGLTVYAQARPVRYRWDFGDDTTTSTSTPGRPWPNGGGFGHTYQTRGTYEVTVTVVWQARWRMGDSAWRRLGSFTTGSSTTYPVRQMVALLVPALH
jgi:hypothetical protein